MRVPNHKLPEVYQQIDFIVMTSTTDEALGLVPLEAACFGVVPIVLSTLVNVVEFIRQSNIGYVAQNIPDIVKIFQSFKGKNFDVYSLKHETKEKMRSYIEENIVQSRQSIARLIKE